MKSKGKIIWTIVGIILVTALIYYIIDNKIKSNLITNQTEEIENLKSQLEIKNQTAESTNQYLERIDNELTYCESDLDCIKGINGCCPSKSLNQNYKELWEKSQKPCPYACVPETGMWEFALCENNKCILIELNNCKEDSECKAYDMGCVNKNYVERIGIAKLQIKETKEWTCKCSNNRCNIR